MQMLDQCLVSVMNWMWVNKMKLHHGKTEALLISGTQVQKKEKSGCLFRLPFSLKEQVHSLGLLFNSSLSVEAQMFSEANSILLQLHLVY